MLNQTKNQVVFTNRARCRDCYRCIRFCPVGAIGMDGDQAFVDHKKCISCGTCIRQCPQKAKTFRKDIDAVIEKIKSGKKVAATIAPSFAAVFDGYKSSTIPSVLRKLGFFYAAETAVGAYYVAKATCDYIKNKKGLFISTACPAIVSYIEKYQHNYIPNLVPIMSPMAAHGSMIKHKFGKDTIVVFIGPCTAKKSEADFSDSVDFAITFSELTEWFQGQGIKLEDLEESSFDEIPAGFSRTFAAAGGSLKTAGLETDVLSRSAISVCGIEQFEDAMKIANKSDSSVLIEPLFCQMGCINGPDINDQTPCFVRRKHILDYAQNCKTQENPDECKINLTQKFKAVETHLSKITQEQILEILKITGKEDEKDRLNCGACGYDTCIKQAEAVATNMAEAQMCVALMRRLAEQRTDKIIETSPNGIVVMNEKLEILHINPSFKRMFMCSEAICGKRISYLLDPQPFEQIEIGNKDFVEITTEHSKYGLICHQIIYSLKQDKQIVGVFVNLTNTLKNKEKLDDMRQQTIQQARDLLNHQIDFSAKIAQYLGKSSAQTQTLLDNLVDIAKERISENNKNSQGSKWLKDIYISK